MVPANKKDHLSSQIIELFKSGLSSRDVAKKLSCDSKTVCKYLKLAGIDPSLNKKKVIKSKLSKLASEIDYKSILERDNLIMSMYAGGSGCHIIGKSLGIGKRTVLRVLANNNISRSNKYGTNLSPGQSNTITDLYSQGYSIEHISRLTNIGNHIVRNVIGDKIRDPGSTMSNLFGMHDEVINLYKSGLSSYDIANKLNFTNPDCISKFLRRNKIIRSRKEANALILNKLSLAGHKSAPQRQVELFLNDLGVEYSPEYVIDGWSFDIRVGNVLFEIQSKWHNVSRERVNRDVIKRRVAIDNGYKVVYIWDRLINNRPDFVIDQLRYHIGLNKIVDFSFNEIRISESRSDAEKLIQYHYYGKLGNVSKSFVAYIGDEPVACCVFGNVVRHEIAIKQGVSNSEILELSRLCINPLYQKKNFGSWFIGKCVKLIKMELKNIKVLVSFSDYTYGHEGTVYRASNWKLDGSVASDYWYLHNKITIIHKKTIWNRANKLGISESEYANANNMIKVFGMPKNRYILRIKT